MYPSPRFPFFHIIDTSTYSFFHSIVLLGLIHLPIHTNDKIIQIRVIINFLIVHVPASKASNHFKNHHVKSTTIFSSSSSKCRKMKKFSFCSSSFVVSFFLLFQTKDFFSKNFMTFMLKSLVSVS